MSNADTDELGAYRHQLRSRARTLHGSLREPAWVELERVASWAQEHGLEADAYGDGEHLQAFELRVAELLGCPGGRFMPSGTMAQQIAARIWAQRSNESAVGMHPTCHLELHEEQGYRELHQLTAVHVGVKERPLVLADLDRVAQPLAALIVELPTRENGGLLAPFDELVALSQAARTRGIAMHLDGARLWEAAAGYGRPLPEIAALFDSVYVSFYKGIGALPGSMLVGPADFLAEAAVWQRRHGGSLYSQLASWTSASMRLDDQLAKMPRYLDRARAIAEALRAVPGLDLTPETPHVNMFHVTLTGSQDDLLNRRDQAAERHNVWLFGQLQSTEQLDTHRFEVAVGDAAMGLSDEEIVAAFTTLLADDAAA